MMVMLIMEIQASVLHESIQELLMPLSYFLLKITCDWSSALTFHKQPCPSSGSKQKCEIQLLESRQLLSASTCLENPQCSCQPRCAFQLTPVFLCQNWRHTQCKSKNLNAFSSLGLEEEII